MDPRIVDPHYDDEEVTSVFCDDLQRVGDVEESVVCRQVVEGKEQPQSEPFLEGDGIGCLVGQRSIDHAVY